MTTTLGKNRCIKCEKVKSTLRCGGCLEEYCFNHSLDHRQELNKQLDQIEIIRNLFQQTLNEQTTDPEKNRLIQEINEWERDSLNKIRQTAEDARKKLLEYTKQHIEQIETKVKELTKQFQQSREENDFYETDLHYWNEELTRLNKELAKPSNINLREDSSAFINKIYVDITSTSSYSMTTGVNVRWVQTGLTVAGGLGPGNEINQLYNPSSVYVADDQTVYVADYSNHRIVEWKNGATSGHDMTGRNGSRNRNDQLNYPTDVIFDKDSDSLLISDQNNRRVMRWSRRNGTSGETIISNIDCWGLAMDNDGYLYISDRIKHEVRRWKIGNTNGIVVAGGNGQGNHLDQLDSPTYIFVDQDQSIYVSDGENHRVVKWKKGAKQGIVVAGGEGQGSGLTQLSNPRGVVVDQFGTVYVADCSNHRIMRWPEEAAQGNVVVGGNRKGGGPNRFNSPMGVSFDRQGNLYVADNYNHRIQKFSVDRS